MSATKNIVIDAQNAERDKNFRKELRKHSKENLWHERHKAIRELQDERDAHRATSESRDNFATDCTSRDATIAAHEKTIADLEAKVKDLMQWPSLAHEMARNNTRLTTTVDNMAKAAAGLVPPQPMTAR